MKLVKKNICLLKYIDSRQADGGQRVAVNLANSFCEKCEVHFFAVINDGNELAFSLSKEVHCHIFNMHGKRMRQLFPDLIKQVRKCFSENHIDVAMAIGASLNIPMLLGAFGKNIKTIYCEHVNIIKDEYNDKSQQMSQKFGAKYADHVITLTQRDKEEFEKRFPKHRGRIQVIYNWIDDNVLKKDASYNVDSKRIITVARFTHVKGLDDLVEISKKVFEKHPDWHWDIYGTGDADYVKKIENLVDEYEVGENLHLMGQVSDLYDRYQNYSFFVLTSKWEGLPMVLLEAKGCKLPLISYDCPTGPAEIIRDQIDGYLVPAGDKEIIGEKICKLIEEKEVRLHFSQESYGNLELFSKEHILKKWMDLIEG